MAFDWIAGTALAVGMGSLYLTWQSTKAAKKAIDVSIDLHHEQKIYEEEKNKEEIKRKVSALQNVIANTIVPLCQQTSSLCDMYYFLNKNNDILSVSFHERKKLPAIEFKYKEHNEVFKKRFIFMMRDCLISENILMLCAEFSPDLMKKAMSLNNCIHTIETLYNVFLGYSADFNLKAFEYNFKSDRIKSEKLITLLNDTFGVVSDLCETEDVEKFQAYTEFKEAMNKLKLI
ncbi:TPA: hypothetical protein OUB26_001010 [Proteus mirabilis]|uniref:hypothetical protein n=1 Tax=Proteus mirabilis TaxID=584 RepID=UPI00228DF389|nr:hypothetical protein [Proteus mirabilis]EKT9733042.1 hypothetical protein [Proteus mirabilis]EKW6742111.1 hypothetical protein [Proteus mirabilis]MDX4948366.1 hypothetical protein [Proteus mirabilis]HCT9033961.1 hypothetical protein [Proteus mirabilis]HCZ8574138.1 hypothetical protein [Proteus mirabilis]